MTVEDWILSLTHTQESLSNMPVCPYAKQAYVNKLYQVLDTDIHTIEDKINNADLIKYQVIILKLNDYEQYDIDILSEKTKILNSIYNKKDIVILDNDPRTPFFIKDIKTTYEDGYLWLLQSLSDLTDKSNILKKTDYYNHWTKEQLDEVVNWRVN